jgi:hypothetical protein
MSPLAKYRKEKWGQSSPYATRDVPIVPAVPTQRNIGAANVTGRLRVRLGGTEDGKGQAQDSDQRGDDTTREWVDVMPDLWRSRRKSQIPPDLVVKSQAIDMAEIILSRIRRPNAVHTLCRNRISRFEQLSTSEAH